MIEGQIAMHHYTDADRANLLQWYTILSLHHIGQLLIAGLYTRPGLRQRIGPNAVYQLVFPAETATGHGPAVFCD